MLLIFADLLEFLVDDDLLEFLFAFFDNLLEFSVVFLPGLCFIQTFGRDANVGFGGANPEVLIALNSSYQSGILLYYIVNNAASSQQLQIIIIIFANNNATRRIDSRGGRGVRTPGPKNMHWGGPKSKGPPNKNGTCLLFITNTDKITFLSRQIFLSQNLENRISRLLAKISCNNHNTSMYYT